MEQVFDSEASTGRDLLKELVELRVLRCEKSMIQQTNQFYVQQLSQLEVKISELKAIAQARQVEILKLREHIRQLDWERSCKDSTGTISLNELEAKFSGLERENSQMRGIASQDIDRWNASSTSRPSSSLNFENERLLLELFNAKQVKDSYEAKYKEAKTELLSLQNRDHFDIYRSKDAELTQQHLEQTQVKLAQTELLLDQALVRATEIERLLDEQTRRESQNLQFLRESELKNADLEGQLTQLYEENRRLSEIISQQWRISSSASSPIHLLKEASFKPLPLSPTSPQGLKQSSQKVKESKLKQSLKPILPSPTKSQTSTNSPHSSLRGTPKQAIYVPSFMRSKKAFLPLFKKSGSTNVINAHQSPLTLGETDSDFDMSIPEETHHYA